jgi:hypothetical protein
MPVHFANSSPVNEHFIGLTSIIQGSAADGTLALYTESKLDLDTDGINNGEILEPNPKHLQGSGWDSDHQWQTSYDKAGSWLCALDIPYFVLPGGFASRHGIKLGMAGTILFHDEHVHAVYADDGPTKKYGEASVKVHESFGITIVKNRRIRNIGIDSGVYILMYPGTQVAKPNQHFTIDDINKVADPLFKKFLV